MTFAGIAVWWFLRTCPPEVAMDEIVYLEGQPLGPLGRLLPVLLTVLGLVLFAAVVAWLVWR